MPINPLLPPEEPGYTYGTVLPLRRKGKGQPLELAVPSMARDLINDMYTTLVAPANAFAGNLSLQKNFQELLPRWG